MNFEAVFIIGIITLGIYRLFELFARKGERMAIIDKIGDKIKLSESNSIDLNLPLFSAKNYSSWALKISLLLIGIGLGLLIAFFIYYRLISEYLVREIDDYVRRNLYEAKEIVYLSCMAIFGGIGLLVAYIIDIKKQKSMLKKD